MVAERHRIDADGEEVLKYAFGQPEAARGVLAVGDDRVDVVLLAGEVEVFAEDFPSRRSDDVADDEKSEGSRC